MILINILRRKTPSKNFNEKKEKHQLSCDEKKINNQTASENVTIVNVVDEVFDVHRRFILIDEKNENFTVAAATNEANETSEKKMKLLSLTKQQKKRNKQNDHC